MNCPECGFGGVGCVDSRPKNGTVYRRRRCLNCDYRYSTIEISLEDMDTLKEKEKLLEEILNVARNGQTKLKERETK